MNILKYITLGFEVFNAVTTLIVMVRNPTLLNTVTVWNVISPVLVAVTTATGVKVNMAIARQLVIDAVNTLKAILTKKAAAK